MDETTSAPKQNIIHTFDSSKFSSDSSSNKMSVLVVVGFLLLGIGTGFVVSKVAGKPASSVASKEVVGEDGKVSLQKGQIFGADEKAFKDQAEGELLEGGIEGEGEYHLKRPGGESQNVYLTSSVIDLSQFVGKKIRVWGQTYEAEKAGWLMDVGRVQIL